MNHSLNNKGDNLDLLSNIWDLRRSVVRSLVRCTRNASSTLTLVRVINEVLLLVGVHHQLQSFNPRISIRTFSMNQYLHLHDILYDPIEKVKGLFIL